jgi:hypothetical protein
MRHEREAGVGCMLITEGRVGYVGLGLWGMGRCSGWVVRAVERVKESPEGVPCSGRVSAASLKQVMAIFENVHVSFQKLPPSTRGQKRGCCYSTISVREGWGRWRGQ